MFEKNRFAGSNSQYIRFPFRDFIAAQKKLGISRIDLVGAVPHLWCDHISPIQTEEVKRILEEEEMEVTVFSPKAYRYSIYAEPETVQASATLNYYRNCINAAGELGCAAVALPLEGACFDQPRERLWNNAVQMLEAICGIAGGQGIAVLLPSVTEEVSPILTSLKDVKEMTGQIGSGALAVLLDIPVISVQGETISQWFGQLGEKIKLVRFTDGNYNGCRVWGEGCLPCERFLKELESSGYDGMFSLQMPGEKYVDAPYDADKRNLSSLERFLR